MSVSECLTLLLCSRGAGGAVAARSGERHRLLRLDGQHVPAAAGSLAGGRLAVARTHHHRAGSLLLPRLQVHIHLYWISFITSTCWTCFMACGDFSPFKFWKRDDKSTLYKEAAKVAVLNATYLFLKPNFRGNVALPESDIFKKAHWSSFLFKNKPAIDIFYNEWMIRFDETHFTWNLIICCFV